MLTAGLGLKPAPEFEAWLVAESERLGRQRRPIGTFAPRTPAALALTRLWDGIERKLAQIAATPAPA